MPDRINQNQLDNWKAGDAITAKQLQQPVDILRNLQQYQQYPEFRNLYAGRLPALRLAVVIDDAVDANEQTSLVGSGAEGTDKHRTDNSYWCKWVKNNNDSTVPYTKTKTALFAQST